jgi:uncharacterized membrane protein|tara:strand:- start:224 stop:556 length:333 start_codon:yes stop_codon:yes gene_type:complete
MKKVSEFFKRSYATDRTAFYAEITETIVLIVASATLSLTIVSTAESNPWAYIFMPLYLIGSLLGMFSTYRRGSSALVMTVWFTIINIYAIIQLFEIVPGGINYGPITLFI